MKYVIESPQSHTAVIAVRDHILDAGKQVFTSSIKQQTPSKSLQISPQLSPSVVANFNELPDCGYVRQPVVLALFGCSKATLWRWVKSCRVPSPKKLGSRISAWQVGELRVYLQKIDNS